MAAELIGPFRSRKVLPALLAACERRGRPHPRGGGPALGRLAPRRGGKRGKPPCKDMREGLVAALRTDKARKVRQAAASTLGVMDPERDPATKEFRLVHDLLPAPCRDWWPPSRTPTPERVTPPQTIRRMGKDAGGAVPDLVKILKDRDIDTLTRTTVDQAPGKIGPPDAVPALPVLKEVLGDAKAPWTSAGRCGEPGQDGQGRRRCGAAAGHAAHRRAGQGLAASRGCGPGPAAPEARAAPARAQEGGEGPGQVHSLPGHAHAGPMGKDLGAKRGTW